MVRKGGFEPPRSCERQPLKLADLVCWCELTRIHQADLQQTCTAAHASADFIRTHSHTTRLHGGSSGGSSVNTCVPRAHHLQQKRVRPIQCLSTSAGDAELYAKEKR